MLVEAECAITIGVDDDGPGSEPAAAGDDLDQGVPQQVGTEPSTLLRTVERQHREEQHRDDIRLAARKSRRGNVTLDAPIASA